MDKTRLIIVGLVILFLCIWSSSVGIKTSMATSKPANEGQDYVANVPPSTDSEQYQPWVQVALTAPYSTGSWDSSLENPEHFVLPLLYLHQERNATTEDDRRLTIDVSGLEEGSEVEFELLSWHVNINTGDHHRETLSIRLPECSNTNGKVCRMEWVLDAEGMPSDLYSFRIWDGEGKLLWENYDHNRPDLVILDRWDVPIDAYTIRITYAVLFPFDHGENYHAYRLAPDAVTDFIEQHFVPIIIDTWRTQFDGWGFGPIHPDWDPDRVIEIYITTPPFALFDGTGTYTAFAYKDGTIYPERRLWWYSSNNSFQHYGLLEDGFRITFAHEFFHLVQWNVLLSTGCSTQRWTNAFIEAQGKFVPSVQYPEIEILTGHLNGLTSQYGATATSFLNEKLNTSYQNLEADRDEKYELALYWRFLYEQFGDMGVIRAALEEMACQYDPDIVNSMGDVMDAAFARFEGPFKTYEESLKAFARANYALRLEGGRCVKADTSECGDRYYDPYNIYPDPPLKAVIEYSGDRITYEDAIPASFGMDFVEVNVNQELSRQSLFITLTSSGTRLSVEIWELGSGLWERSRALTLSPEPMLVGEDGVYTYSIPHFDPTKYLKLALIITRLDPNEQVNPMGSYTITLEGSQSKG